MFNILWLKNNECLLFGKDQVNEKYALPFEVLDHLLIVISGLLFIWQLIPVTLFLVRRFVYGSHFSHVCFVLHGLVSVWFHDIWKFDYDASWQKF